MARAPKAAETTAVTNWEEEMAAQAKAAAAQEAHVGGGQFFSTRAGVLACDGQALPGNEMAVLIVDGILENVYYADQFDADDIASPVCFAFGREEADMAPHLNVTQNGTAQHETCKGCEKNEFGSSNTGRGKACGNRRRLALLPAGTFDKRKGEFTAIDDPAHYSKTDVRYLKVPPTSIGAYAAYVKQLAGGIKRPPHGVFTKISLRPHAKKQFEVVFEALAEVPNELLGAVMERHKQEMSLIEFPYQLSDGATKKAAPVTKGRKFTRS